MADNEIICSNTQYKALHFTRLIFSWQKDQEKSLLHKMLILIWTQLLQIERYFNTRIICSYFFFQYSLVQGKELSYFFHPYLLQWCIFYPEWILPFQKLSHLSIGFILSIGTYNFVIGHTKPKAPDPIRTPKLSGLRRG